VSKNIGPISPAKLEELINAVEEIVEKESGINFDKKK